LTDTRLVELSREAFDSLRAQNRPAAYKIIVRLARALGDRRREADARIREVFDDPADKLEEFDDMAMAFSDIDRA
jgi:CRP-like cAMP-binding protein